jgi:hypothetical protein
MNLAGDHSMVALVVLLDLSAAFDDTVNYDTLLDTMEKEFGITGKALSWHSPIVARETSE